MSRLHAAFRVVAAHHPEFAEIAETSKFDPAVHTRIVRAFRKERRYMEAIYITQENQQNVANDPTIIKQVLTGSLRTEVEYLALCHLGIEYLQFLHELDDIMPAMHIYQRQIEREGRP